MSFVLAHPSTALGMTLSLPKGHDAPGASRRANARAFSGAGDAPMTREDGEPRQVLSAGAHPLPPPPPNRMATRRKLRTHARCCPAPGDQRVHVVERHLGD